MNLGVEGSWGRSRRTGWGGFPPGFPPPSRTHLPLQRPPQHRGSIYSLRQRSVGCERAERHCLVRKGGAWFGPAPPPSPRSSVKGGQAKPQTPRGLFSHLLCRRVSLSPEAHGPRFPVLPQLCNLLPVTTSDPCLLPVPNSPCGPSHLPCTSHVGTTQSQHLGGPPFPTTPGVQAGDIGHTGSGPQTPSRPPRMDPMYPFKETNKNKSSITWRFKQVPPSRSEPP